MATIVDDFSPIFVGDTGAPFAPVFLYPNTDLPFNLTGYSISMHMVCGATNIHCTGTWTIDNAAQGLAHYQFTSTDVQTPGVWNMYIILTIGGLPMHCSKKTIEILQET